MKITSLAAVIAVCLGALSGGGTAAAEGAIDGRWTVIAGSVSEELNVATVEDDGAEWLEARIGDRILEGFIEGNRIVLRGGGLVLTGWVGYDTQGRIFLAGHRRETTAGGARETGWIAARRPAAPAGDETAPEKAENEQAVVEQFAGTVDTAAEQAHPVQIFDLDLDEITSPAPSPTRQAPAPQAASDQTIFSGEWSGPDGVYVVQQDGRRLTVHRPNGEIVQGRQTGDAALVVGFRVGCCRGELQPAGTIEWQDGAIWRRPD